MSKTKNNIFPRKGEIWLLKNHQRIKEISKDYRPVLIISENEQNEFSDFIVTLPLSTNLKSLLFTEVMIKKTPSNGLDQDSKILCYSPFTWDKELRLEKKLGLVSEEIMEQVEKTWKMTFFQER